MPQLHFKDLRSAIAAIDCAVSGMDAEQLSLRPAEQKWCAAEILEHLDLSYVGTIRAAERCLATGKRAASPPTLKQRVGRFIVTRLGLFPGGRAAPKKVVPTGKRDANMIVDQLRTNLAAMDKRFSECAEKFGLSGDLIDHPVLGPLSIHQWIRFHLVHCLHHMKQVERIKKLSRHAPGSLSTKH